MRSFIAYLLLIALMLPTLSPWGTIAYFHLNRAHIARVLCENRNRPQLNCNGKCYLAKKLKKQQEKKEKETAERIENIPVANLFFVTASSFLFPVIFVPKQTPGFVYRLCHYSAALRGLLKPPRL